MKASIKNIEQTIASEQYRPALSEEYQELFQRLTRRLEATLPMNRARIISDELRRVSETAREADLDCQKYMAALSVLVDLSLQGWIDEYADLIQTAEMQGKRKEFEKFLSMLAQKVRSLGIHLIIATQRPSANIVTGVLKANIPYRISFRLPSHTDSQTILDMPGAENLLGKGDMLMVTDSDTIRMQGLYISEDELDNFVKSRQ